MAQAIVRLSSLLVASVAITLAAMVLVNYFRTYCYYFAIYIQKFSDSNSNLPRLILFMP